MVHIQPLEAEINELDMLMQATAIEYEELNALYDRKFELNLVMGL
ncbi:hypothetical protein [Bacillus sp. CGMCC 1.16541]|nr:hypothetical protein [Bacillus sp. CGMCC 1.16541]